MALLSRIISVAGRIAHLRAAEPWAVAFFMIIQVIASAGAAVPSGGTDHIAGLCHRAARTAAAETNVPLSVLTAITLGETGRRGPHGFAPWPWTVNLEGRGFWFASRAEAEDFVARHHAAGARSYDVGCFQVNYKWHGGAFASPLAMFEPEANAAYAAGFLKRLYAELGDWSLAAGAYHSRTPALAEPYRVRFDRLRTTALDLDQVPPLTALPALALLNVRAPRENRFPLLIVQNGAGSAGSAFPAAAPFGRAFLALNRKVGALWDD